MKNGMIKNSDGKYWYKNDELHREDRGADGRVLPAVIGVCGAKHWYKEGELHREDRCAAGRVLPAVIESDGTKEWWENGKIHREDGPAIIDSKGGEYWFWEDVEVKRENHPWWVAQQEKKKIEEVIGAKKGEESEEKEVQSGVVLKVVRRKSVRI